MGNSPGESSGAEDFRKNEAEFEASVLRLIAASSPDSGHKPDDLEAEILGRNDRVRAISYCNSKGEQVGPHFLEMFSPTTKDGVDYWHGRILDGRFGHFSMVDGSEAFGGPTKEDSDKFEKIDGKSYKRVKEENGRVALKDVRGERYTGFAHDTINRPEHPTHLDDQGVVYHVTDDGKEGWYLDEKLCGGNKNGMNHKTTIVKAGDEKSGYKIFLIAENKEGFKKVVDIKTGEIMYADEDNCTELELLPVGTEICAIKTYEDTQEVRSEKGDVIYYGLSAKTGEFIHLSGGPFARTFDDRGGLTIVDRRSDGATCRPRFGTDKPARREGTGSPEGNGIFNIGTRHLIELFVDNPDASEEGLLVTFRDKDGNDPFRGPHYKLGKTKDDKPRMVTVGDITGILFENKSKAIYYIGSNGNEMFGGQHWDELDTIENWGYGPEGRRMENPITLKHFVELSDKHVVLNCDGKALFPKNPDAEKIEGHTKIKDFWVLSYQKDGEDRNVLVAEAKDPVGFFKRVAGIFTGNGWAPSTYYLQDGKKAGSMDELKRILGAPEDAKLAYAKDFKDPNAEGMKAKKDRARDTRRMQASVPDGVAPEIVAMLRKTEEDAGVSHTGLAEIPLAEGAAGDAEEPAADSEALAEGGGAPEYTSPAEESKGAVEEDSESAEESSTGAVEETPSEQTSEKGKGTTELGSWLVGDDGDSTQAS